MHDAEIGGQLSKLKEDLEYGRVSIFTCLSSSSVFYHPNPVSCVTR